MEDASTGLRLHPEAMAVQGVVLVVLDVNKDICTHALNWALGHVARKGDVLRLVGVLSHVLNPSKSIFRPGCTPTHTPAHESLSTPPVRIFFLSGALSFKNLVNMILEKMHSIGTLGHGFLWFQWMRNHASVSEGFGFLVSRGPFSMVARKANACTICGIWCSGIQMSFG